MDWPAGRSVASSLTRVLSIPSTYRFKAAINFCRGTNETNDVVPPSSPDFDKMESGSLDGSIDTVLLGAPASPSSDDAIESVNSKESKVCPSLH